LNTECFAVINSKTLATGVSENMETDFLPENSWRTTDKFNPDKEVNLSKRIKVMSRRVVPKEIL
jgi:hypothetical protein